MSQDKQYRLRLQKRLEQLRGGAQEMSTQHNQFERAITAVQEECAANERTLLSDVTQSALDAMHPRAHALAVANVDIRKEIDRTEREHADRLAAIDTLVEERDRLRRSRAEMHAIAEEATEATAAVGSLRLL